MTQAPVPASWLLPLNDREGILYGNLAFGLCTVAGVLLRDALTAPRRGVVRTAGLTPRRVRDYVPPRITRLLLGLAVALVTCRRWRPRRHRRTTRAGRAAHSR